MPPNIKVERGVEYSAVRKRQDPELGREGGTLDFCEEPFLPMASSYRLSFGTFCRDTDSRQSGVELWRSGTGGRILQSFPGCLAVCAQNGLGES